MQWLNLALDLIGIAVLGTLLFHLLRATKAGAPFIPTWGGHIKKLVALAGVKPGDTVYELGCGDGRFSIASAKAGAARVVGYDISSMVVRLAQLRAWLTGAGTRVRFSVANIRTCDPSDADIVYLYLMPEITNALAAGPLQKLKPGARVLSSSFRIDTGTYPFRLITQEKIGLTTVAYLYERV